MASRRFPNTDSLFESQNEAVRPQVPKGSSRRKAHQAERRLRALPSRLSERQEALAHALPLWRQTARLVVRPVSFGQSVSLLEAREKRDAARKLLLAGKDPAAEKKADEAAEARRAETTFAAYADLYLDRLAKAGRSPATLKKSKWIVEVLASDLRAHQLADITPRDVLRVVRAVEAKGNRETARRMRGVLSAVFRLAVIEDAVRADPTAPLKGALLPPETRHQAAITKPEGSPPGLLTAKYGLLH